MDTIRPLKKRSDVPSMKNVQGSPLPVSPSENWPRCQTPHGYPEAELTSLMQALSQAKHATIRMSLEIVFGFVGAVSAVIKLLLDRTRTEQAQTRLNEAEQDAFKSVPESLDQRTQNLLRSQTDLEARAGDVARLLEESRSAVQMGSLFNLYSKQIEKYQTQTQARASWSFIFALVAMIAGLGLVVWGGSHIIAGGGWEHVAAGSIISITGGAVSAFITKTFLDVHRMSLLQLNHYFRQPVLNTNILTAQRLADQLPEADKQKAYAEIIGKIAALISAEPVRNENVVDPVFPIDMPADPKKKRQKAKPAPERAVVVD